jgi:predicted amidophosphoribosyltransferase
VGIPYSLRALVSTRNRARQVSLSRSKRARNVLNAFHATNRVKGNKILLIDDIITTGSSVTQATKACLAAGATSVDIISLARVKKFSVKN